VDSVASVAPQAPPRVESSSAQAAPDAGVRAPHDWMARIASVV